MKRYLYFLIVSFLIIACASRKSNSFDMSAPESYWPPISEYTDMELHELSVEISMIKKNYDSFKKFDDQKNRRLTIQAKNRLELLIQLYSVKSGRNIESVRKMFGV